jgi:hypothetical protein
VVVAAAARRLPAAAARSEQYRHRVARALPPEKLAALESFRDKADAWSSVAGGAS